MWWWTRRRRRSTLTTSACTSRRSWSMRRGCRHRSKTLASIRRRRTHQWRAVNTSVMERRGLRAILEGLRSKHRTSSILRNRTRRSYHTRTQLRTSLSLEEATWPTAISTHQPRLRTNSWRRNSRGPAWTSAMRQAPSGSTPNPPRLSWAKRSVSVHRPPSTAVPADLQALSSLWPPTPPRQDLATLRQRPVCNHPPRPPSSGTHPSMTSETFD